MSAALLAEVWRGSALELRIRGHIAVADAQGRLLASLGDPEEATVVRSAVKPLQALAFVESGAWAALGETTGELALACASHTGEPVHVTAARSLLAGAGLEESQLGCGPQWPARDEAARELAARGEVAGRIHNNCSGKHAAMLATCLHEGWPLTGYRGSGHPLQRRISGIMSDLMGVDLRAAPAGIDGCGLQTHAVPLLALARGFATAQVGGGGFRSCQDAMARHLHLVGGTGRFDSAVLAVAGSRLTVKSGGAAVWAAVSRDRGMGIALKLEAGTTGPVAPVAVAALQALGLLPADLPVDLVDHAAGELRNWEGDVVGHTHVVERLHLA